MGGGERPEAGCLDKFKFLQQTQVIIVYKGFSYPASFGTSELEAAPRTRFRVQGLRFRAQGLGFRV